MINLGVVGLGRWGRRHVDAAIASGRFRIERAATKTPGLVEGFAAARSIALAAGIEELLADPRVDAVSLATPHSLHVPQILQAAAAGKHVLAEKPFALSKSDAERAIAACTAAGIVIAVGHDNRFYPAIAEIRRIVESGSLGEILHAEANLSHDFMRKGTGNMVSQGALAAAASPTSSGAGATTPAWRLDRHEAPAGAVVHLGVHRIDSMVQIFGKIDYVFAQASRDALSLTCADTVSMLVRFQSGATGYLGSSLATPLNSRFQVFGSQGWVEARGPRDMDEYLLSSLKSVSVRLSGGYFDSREFEAVDSVKLNFEAFADAIEGKSPYPIPLDEMVHVAAVTEAVARSLKTRLLVLVA